MTAIGATERLPVKVGAAVRYVVGIGGLAFSMTILWLSMRAVMGIGGACASGGPYVPAVECPDAVVLLTPVSIFAGMAALGLAIWGGASLGGGWVALIFLAWPALFLSLGWNFLEFGLRPPGGEPGEFVWSWLFCAVVFGLMGGVPLALGVWGARQAGSPSAGAPLAARQVFGTPRGRYAINVIDRRPAPRSIDATELAGRLERLARLHVAGDLTDTEFEAAKRATLDEAGA
jgi:hypothetical protein